ncbi:MAG: hypothetical protein IT368_14340 [Candidatus Hydrogenedentes bacterium]|nr:hypothetical protein [Candidatus Hydrogenedentota bacterium]
MKSKVTIGLVLLLVIIAVLPFVFKVEPEAAQRSTRANLTPDQQKQVELNSPVEISPDQFERLKYMTSRGANVSLSILPVRVGAIERTEDAATANDLARMMNDAGLCKAEPAKQSLLLKASMNDPNEMNKLLNMAREFQDYVKKTPPTTDYVLYADYIFTPNWEFVMVHFVVCDRQGEWVIRDLQNSHHPDYQSINPKSKEDCNKLVVKRLESWLRD